MADDAGFLLLFGVGAAFGLFITYKLETSCIVPVGMAQTALQEFIQEESHKFLTEYARELQNEMTAAWYSFDPSDGKNKTLKVCFKEGTHWFIFTEPGMTVTRSFPDAYDLADQVVYVWPEENNKE